jgi:hypothetical protein
VVPQQAAGTSWLAEISSFVILKQKKRYCLKMYLAVWTQFHVFGICMVQVILDMQHDCRLLGPHVFSPEVQCIGKCSCFIIFLLPTTSLIDSSFPIRITVNHLTPNDL